MNGDCLLDTNIVIAILNLEPAVEEKLKTRTAYISVIVLGELYFGAYNSARPEENVARIDALVDRYVALPCDTATGQHYGQIKKLLRTKGRPIPENDIWIAALARQHALALISRDAHFKEINDLTVELW